MCHEQHARIQNIPSVGGGGSECFDLIREAVGLDTHF